MRIRKLYGIGVGPGDPELLTLKAYRILKEVDMIVAPKSREDKRSLALLTIEGIMKREEKEWENEPIVVEPVFPMTKDRDKLEQYWKKAREVVLARAKAKAKGKGCETVAFVTLGDPSMYSTFYRFMEIFKDVMEEVEVVPGVTSFSACSAIAKVPVAEGNEIVSIVPDVKTQNALRVIESSDSLIFLKPKNMDVIVNKLGNKKAFLGVRVGFKDQEIITGEVSEIDVPTHYLSTLIVKNNPRA